MKTIIVALLAFIAGLTVGLLFGDNDVSDNSEMTQRSFGMDAEAAKTPAFENSAHAGRQKPAADFTVKSNAKSSVTGQDSLQTKFERSQKKIALLKEENESLKQKLEVAREEEIELTGEKMEFPEDLPERLQQAPLMSTLQAAFEELGVDGNVSDTDCSEYPCIIGGTLNDAGGPSFFEKLMNTEAMRSYRNDSKSTGMSTSKSKDAMGNESIFSHFTISIASKDYPESVENRKRTQHRTQQLMEAMGGR